MLQFHLQGHRHKLVQKGTTTEFAAADANAALHPRFVPHPDLPQLDTGAEDGREIAVWFRQQKATRHVPIVFVDGEPEKVARVRKDPPSLRISGSSESAFDRQYRSVVDLMAQLQRSVSPLAVARNAKSLKFVHPLSLDDLGYAPRMM